MPLQKQNIPISFEQGIDSKTDPKQVIPGKLLELENGMFINPKRITKRNGHTKLGTSGTQGYSIASYLDELLTFDGNEARSYVESLTSFQSKGNAVSAEVTTDAILSNDYTQTSMDGAYHTQGLKAFCWEDSRGGGRYSILDAETKQPIVNDASLDSLAQKPKVFALGSYFVFIYYNGTNLKRKYIPVLTPTTLSAAADVATTVNSSNPHYDAKKIGDRVFVAWNDSAGGGAVTVCYLTSTLTVSSTFQKTTEVANPCICIFQDASENVWISYYNGTKIRVFVADYGLLSTVVAPTDVATVSNVRNICGIMTTDTSATAGTGTLVYEISAATTYNYFTRTVTLARSTTTITPGTPADLLRSVGLASKPFTYNGAFYVTLAYESGLQPTYFVANIQNKTLIAKISNQNGGGLTKKSILPEVSKVSDSEFMIPTLEKIQLDVQSGVIFSPTSVVSSTVSFLSQNTFLRATMGRNCLISGGYLMAYDGVSVTEHGFHLFPETPGAPTQATTTGNIQPGTYSYCFVYAWTDNLGQTHRSAPSVPVQVTVPAGTNTNKVTWTIPTVRLTSKRAAFSRAEVVIEGYRTQNNGTIYYRFTSTASPYFNDPTADTVSVVDTQDDTTINGNELLYTTGGVLENIAPPAPAIVASYKTRAIVIPSENRGSFWLSKENIVGSPIEFSDFIVKFIDERDGDLTAFAQLDEKAVFMKKNTVWVSVGNGPDDTGMQDDFSKPELVTTDAGCDNPRSVVVTPNGIMRHTPKGIYLLDRSLSDSYIGAPVERYNDYTITSATLVPNTNQVRFMTEEGVTLVFDYLFNQWSTFANQKAVDSCTFQNRHTWIDSAGNVYQETPGAYLDGSASQRIKLKTGWLSFAGLQGFQRVYQLLILGDYKSNHRLRVTVAYDFNPYPVQEVYFEAGDLLAVGRYGDDSTYGSGSPYGGEYPLYQFRLFLARQKCQAVQIGIEEVQDPDYGEGLSLSALNFLVGMKSGTYKLPASRSA